MEPVTLFNNWMNEMNAGATLSEPVTSFRLVVFQFRTNDFDTFSEAVWEPSGKTYISATCAKWAPDRTVYLKVKGFEISGRNVSTAQAGGGWACGQVNLATGEAVSGDYITIVRATGYR